MATLNLKILPNRRKSTGKLGIYVCLTFKKQQRYISTDFEIDDEFQFEDGKVCYRKDAAIMNKRMQYVLQEYQEKMDSLNLKKFTSCAQLKDVLQKDEEETPTITIGKLFAERIGRLEKEKRCSYAKMNEDTYRVISGILGDMPIDYITRNDIKKLHQAMKERGYTNGGIQIRMAHLKATLNEAIDEGLVKYEEHPFKKFVMPASEPRMMDITVNQFQRIKNIPSTCSNKILLARDIFLMSFYLGGINLADLVKADLSGNKLSYTRQKSESHKKGEKSTVLTITDEAREIISKYLIGDKIHLTGHSSYSGLQSYINKCFKLLAEETGIKTSFAYYSARKTFAQFAFTIGVRTEVVEYCIGQSVKKNRPIYNYVRVMQKQADAAVRKVIQYTENPASFDLADMV